MLMIPSILGSGFHFFSNLVSSLRLYWRLSFLWQPERMRVYFQFRCGKRAKSKVHITGSNHEHSQHHSGPWGIYWCCVQIVTYQYCNGTQTLIIVMYHYACTLQLLIFLCWTVWVNFLLKTVPVLETMFMLEIIQYAYVPMVMCCWTLAWCSNYKQCTVPELWWLLETGA